MKNKKPSITFERFVRKYGNIFNSYGISNTELNEKYQNYLTQKGKGRINDYVWSQFQELLLIAAGKSNTEYEFYKGQWEIYLSMADFRRRIEKSKANEIWSLMLNAKLRMHLSQSSVRLYKKIVVSSGHCCEYCDSLNNKQFEIEDVLENQYLGSTNCTREYGCNCGYAFVPQRDKNGRLIDKKGNYPFKRS